MAGSGDAEVEKRAAAEAAAELVEDGMAVGLGTGSTVAHLLPALARRGLQSIRCVSTSPATEEAARELGLPVEDFGSLARLDIAIDGADQVAPDGSVVKGGGGAHLREKIVAAAADRFVVIVDAAKPVDALVPPLPLELFEFGLAATIERLSALGEVRPRGVAPSPDAGVIADYFGEFGDPSELAARFDVDAGVAAHGFFGADLVSEVLIARGTDVERRRIS